MSCSFPRNEKEEVRAVTRNPGMRVSSVENLFGQSLAEVVLFGVPAQVGEGQRRDGVECVVRRFGSLRFFA